jgi:hypothetical protein
MFVAQVNVRCMENLCKHQVASLLTCTNFIKENIIQYCVTWYGSNHGGFVVMFANCCGQQLTQKLEITLEA